MAIKDTLIKFGHAKIKEKELTTQLKNSFHTSCHFDGVWRTQLERYFSFCRYDKDISLQDFCDYENEQLCEKCAGVLETIKERRKLRRHIGALQAVITKYAMAGIRKEKRK